MHTYLRSDVPDTESAASDTLDQEAGAKLGKSDRAHNGFRGYTNETRAGRARTTREETESSNGGVSLARCVVGVASRVPQPIARARPATAAPPVGNQSEAAPGERGRISTPALCHLPELLNRVLLCALNGAGRCQYIYVYRLLRVAFLCMIACIM